MTAKGKWLGASVILFLQCGEKFINETFMPTLQSVSAGRSEPSNKFAVI